MTRSGVGRSQRTASRLAYAPPTGVWTSVPPANQAAAGRSAVRADRALQRLGLRTLVVAGFAGAAWLLFANAAQAADGPATDRTTDLSVVDLVAAVGNAAPGTDTAADGTASASTSPVRDAVTTARQPVPGSATALTGAVPPVGKATSALAAATAVVLPSATATHAIPLADPAAPAGAAGWEPPGAGVRTDGGTLPVASTAPAGSPTSNGAGPGDLLGSVSGLTLLGAAERVVGPTPLLTSVSRHLALPALADGALRPVAATLPSAASPVSRQLTLAERPGLGSGAAWSSDESRNPPAASRSAGRVVTAVPVGDRAVAATAARATADVVRSYPHSVSRPRAGAEVPAAGRPAASPGTGDVPVRPVPAPLRGWVGPGTSAIGSSAPSEGGSYMAAPATVAGGTAAVRRLPVPAVVAVLRQDAEAPTVSPD